MSYITFEKIWEDYDGMLELLIPASNGKFSCSQNIYIYPDELFSFSKKLSNFPQAIDDMIELEYGSDNPKGILLFPASHDDLQSGGTHRNRD